MTILSFALWLLFVWALGWVALPVARRIWAGVAAGVGAQSSFAPGDLPDAGLAAGRVLLLWGWTLLSFWLGNARVSTRACSWLIYAIIGVCLYYGFRDREILRQLVRERRRALLMSDGVFLAVFAVFFILRGYWPDINNGEKPMDMILLSSLAHANYLPPPNPYAAGMRLSSYYYLGHFQAALISDALMIAPRWAYNLMCASLPALCYSTLAALAAGVTKRLRNGLVAAVLLLTAGTLEPLRQWFMPPAGVEPKSWPLDYFATSRVIPNTINEYPWFTFNYADLHAHYYAMPLALLIVSLGWALYPRRENIMRDRFTQILVGICALMLGALLITNTWDVPVYTLFIGFCLVSLAVVKEALPDAQASLKTTPPVANFAVRAGGGSNGDPNNDEEETAYEDERGTNASSFAFADETENRDEGDAEIKPRTRAASARPRRTTRKKSDSLSAAMLTDEAEQSLDATADDSALTPPAATPKPRRTRRTVKSNANFEATERDVSAAPPKRITRTSDGEARAPRRSSSSTASGSTRAQSKSAAAGGATTASTTSSARAANSRSATSTRVRKAPASVKAYKPPAPLHTNPYVRAFAITVAVAAVAVLCASPFLFSLHSEAQGPNLLEQPGSPTGAWLLLWLPIMSAWVLTLVAEARYRLAYDQTELKLIKRFLIIPAALWLLGKIATGRDHFVLLFLLTTTLWTAREAFLVPQKEAFYAWLCRVALCGLLALVWSETTWTGFLGPPYHRQDTVFKFGMQAWYLLGIAAVCGALRMIATATDEETEDGAPLMRDVVAWKFWPKPAQLAFLVILPVCLVASLSTTVTRAHDFKRFEGWDAWGHLAPPERHAAAWLAARAGDGVNLIEAEEKKGGDYTEYTRYAHATGLSGVIGPQAHSFQWGVGWDQVMSRKEDTRAFYTTEDAAQAEAILRKYNVKYIVCGQMERTEYGDEAVARVEGRMRIVFQDGEGEHRTTILAAQ